jgi:hypothetical protein
VVSERIIRDENTLARRVARSWNHHPLTLLILEPVMKVNSRNMKKKKKKPALVNACSDTEGS